MNAKKSRECKWPGTSYCFPKGALVDLVRQRICCYSVIKSKSSLARLD